MNKIIRCFCWIIFLVPHTAFGETVTIDKRIEDLPTKGYIVRSCLLSSSRLLFTSTSGAIYYQDKRSKWKTISLDLDRWFWWRCPDDKEQGLVLSENGIYALDDTPKFHDKRVAIDGGIAQASFSDGYMSFVSKKDNIHLAYNARLLDIEKPSDLGLGGRFGAHFFDDRQGVFWKSVSRNNWRIWWSSDQGKVWSATNLAPDEFFGFNVKKIVNIGDKGGAIMLVDTYMSLGGAMTPVLFSTSNFGKTWDRLDYRFDEIVAFKGYTQNKAIISTDKELYTISVENSSFRVNEVKITSKKSLSDDMQIIDVVIRGKNIAITRAPLCVACYAAIDIGVLSD
ncbi:MAG: hypothetical protein OEZ43_21655 [Gammaproteobacteria bacterium]|nr:hypothetical protein [Gammaproteobacteria bacterium]